MEENKRSKGNTYCCVPQCKTYYLENVSFHKFPTDKLLRTKWINKLKIGKVVSTYMKVCGKHFREEDYFFNKRLPSKRYKLKTNVVPSNNLPKGAHDLKGNEKLISQRKRRLENREKKKIDASHQIQTEHMMTQIEPEGRMKNTADIVEMEVANTLVSFANEEIIKVKEYVDVGVQVNTYEEFNEFDVSDIINTDCKVRMLTGIQNLTLLNIFIQALSNLDKSKSKLNSKKLILLTLMRIKLDIPFTAISALFNIGHTSAQTYFKKTVKNLSCILKTLISFPSKDENLCNMPRCFDKFPNTRIILDCTEVELQKSTCLRCRIRTYSFYKSKHTVKFLIGTAPSGLIIYVSKAYGGRASDKAIFNKENLISKLDPGDAIMVDKGFLIDNECAEQFVKLIRPPYLRNKKQLESSDALKTAEIARARVHIERVIQRLKLFRIFRNVIPFKMLPYINDIVTIIVALTNLSKPVLSSEKFS